MALTIHPKAILDWEGRTDPGEVAAALVKDFVFGVFRDGTAPSPDGEILVALYSYADYSGNAIVIGRDEAGELFEVHGSHCSCYGLEGQWEPEPTSFAALQMRDRLCYEFEDSDMKDRVLELLWDLSGKDFPKGTA